MTCDIFPIIFYGWSNTILQSSLTQTSFVCSPHSLKCVAHGIACLALWVQFILLSLMSNMKAFSFQLFAYLLFFSQQVKKVFLLLWFTSSQGTKITAIAWEYLYIHFNLILKSLKYTEVVRVKALKIKKIYFYKKTVKDVFCLHDSICYQCLYNIEQER